MLIDSLSPPPALTPAPGRTRRAGALLAAAALLLILIGGFRPFYLQVLFFPRDNLTRTLEVMRFRKAPMLEPFAQGVLERTPPGSAIALVLPFHDWTAYAYHFYRASYVLAGRRLLPTLDEAAQPHPENIGKADYIAAWPVAMPAPAGWVEIWRGAGGVLLKRIAPLP